jgi:Na+-transporting NADH:ubiquinone oxidoreductase subunit NqrE
MTQKEGFRRMRVVAGSSFALGVVLVVVSVLDLFDSKYMNSQPNAAFGFLGLIGIFLAIFGGLYLVIGWVVEGFFRNSG